MSDDSYSIWPVVLLGFNVFVLLFVLIKPSGDPALILTLIGSSLVIAVIISLSLKFFIEQSSRESRYPHKKPSYMGSTQSFLTGPIYLIMVIAGVLIIVSVLYFFIIPNMRVIQ